MHATHWMFALALATGSLTTSAPAGAAAGPVPGPVGGHHGLASGLVARDGEPAQMPGRAGDGGIQSWVLELEWNTCTAPGGTTWRPGPGPNACQTMIARAVADARAYNKLHHGAAPARIKIRLRAGQFTPAIRGVATMPFGCPDDNNKKSRTTSIPQWWDPDYLAAYRQWLSQVNSWIAHPALPGGQRDARDVVSDVTISAPMTCFAEPMVRQPDRETTDATGVATTNAARMTGDYATWRKQNADLVKRDPADYPKVFGEADVRTWKRSIDIHREVLTIVPSSLTMNPFQYVTGAASYHPVWDPAVPSTSTTILGYARTRLGIHRLVEENNSVGVGDIPGSAKSGTAHCPTLRSNLAGTPRTVGGLYDQMYCRMRLDATRGWATHYQTETATKIHDDARATTVAENTAAVCSVVRDIAVLQRGLDAEPPQSLPAANEAHYDLGAPCMVQADRLLEANAVAFARGPRH